MKKETKLRASGIIGKVSSLVLSTALLASTFTGLGNSAAFTAQAASSPTSSAAIVPSASGDLPDHIYDGVILHAWNWSFNAIKDNLAAIADAGYVAVQTSPVQRPKEYSQSSDQTGWWKVYQPTTLSFSPGGHPWFGSKDDFKAMCEEADKYGIKIIVDVVANHLANNSGKIGNSKSDISDQNDPTYKNDDSCWHLNGSNGIDYNNPRRDGSTSSLTYGFGGWPDLNTGNKKVQNGVIDLLKECIDLGADGFRFDAAKHIELPTDPGGASDFWPTVINAANNYAQSKGVEIYSYGEILDDPGTDIKNYTKYIAVTDNRSSNSTRYGIYENNIGKAASSWLKYDGVSYDKIVLWSESHDTYANNNYSGESAKFSQDQINRSWAIVAARQFPSLYYIRPDNAGNAMGQASKNTAWKNKEVAEVNKFHNAFVGESEYMSSSGNTVLIERGTSGVVLVNISGNGGQFSGKVNKMKDGTYTDQVSGNTFTVSGGNISGSIGSKGIAVVYNATNSPRGSVSATPTDTSFTDTITVTLTANNVTNAKYTTSEGDSGSFTSGQKLTLGSSTSIGSSVTLNLSGTKPDGTTATAKYSYLKKNPNEVTTIYFDNSTYNWNHVYAYVYKPSDDPPPPPPQSSIQFTNSLNWWSVKAYFFNSSGTVGAEWPGTDMTCIGDNGYGSVNYEISIPSGAEMVVFNDGGYGAQTKDLPISGVAGYWLDGSADNAIPWYNPSAEAPSSVAPGDEDTTPCNAKWPGVEMTYDSATKLYKYVVPEAFKDGLVIFSDGAQDTTNRYPGDMEEGLPINDTSKLFSANHSWKDYTAPVPQKLSVSLSVSPSSVKVGEKVTLTATASNATGTVTYTFKAGSETISSSGNTASWTASSEGTTTITVTAKDSNGTATDSKTVTVSGNPDPDGPKVIADKASGTSFDTETLSVKLTLQNAVSGTYCIDNGSVKKFTGSVTVPVGQGKIGDTTVSVKATAKGSDGTEKTFSFTYEKKYKIKTTSSSAASSCDKFVTNPNGAVGKKKTITSASDFTSDMLIAKGIANDDPAAFRGPHEAPKFDLYALYAAWDDTNLYLGIQYTNVIDVVAPEQDAPQGGRGKPNGADADIPQMILLDVKSGDYTDGSTNNADQKTVWNTNITFGGSTKVDRVIMYSPKSGIDNWGVFPVHSGKIDYTSEQTYTPKYQQPLPGASLKWEDGFFLDKMEGIENNGHKGYTPAEIESTSSNWVDFLTKNHSKTQDTFCIMTMPLKYLGITANDISTNGIGVMAVATYGASGIGCLPYDDVMLDVAREAYSADDSTSQEKEDADKITVALASVGKGGSTPVPPTTPLQVNFGADRAAPQLPTTKLTLKGIGMGGTAPYTYAFYVNDKLVQADSSKDSCTFTPGTEGDYTLKCIIKDSTGKTATVTKTFTAEASDDDNPTVLTNKSTLSSTQTIDFINRTSVTVKAAATGGQTPYTYAYFYKKSTESTYKKLKDYSTSASYVFKPDSNVSATYNIKVKIKDAGGSVASKVLNIKATALAQKLTNTSTISAQTIKLGSKLTVNCSAVGGKTPYKFAVYYKKSSSSKYTTAQDYSTNKTVYIKPGAATVYDVKIKLKDAEGSTEVVKIYQFAVTDPDSNNLKNTSKVSSTSMNLGSTLTISGASTGGSGTVKYAAYYKKGSSDFKRIRDYSTTAKMTFKPSAAGTYTIRIKVRDSKTVVNKDVKVTVTNVGLTNKSTVSTTSLGLGNTLTINCAASGGAGGYTYSAYYKKSSSSSFTKIRGYSSNTTMTVTPATATKYIVRVKVKDKNGNVVNKDFNITVSKTSSSNPLTNTSSLSATTVKLGNSITVKCSATGGKTTYKYAVAYKKASSDNYTSVSGYTTTKTFTVKPAAATTYQVRVKVKDANGTIKIKVLKFTAKK